MGGVNSDIPNFNIGARDSCDIGESSAHSFTAANLAGRCLLHQQTSGRIQWGDGELIVVASIYHRLCNRPVNNFVCAFTTRVLSPELETCMSPESLWSGLPIETTVVILVLVALGIYALFNVQAATNTVTANEQKPIDALEAIPGPTSGVEMRDHLRRYSDSQLVDRLRVGMATGVLNTDALPMYDYIHWSRFLAGVFVFIGLLGTVFGISRSINGLSNNTSAGQYGAAAPNSRQATEQIMAQSATLQRKLDELLSGMKSASTSTLAGLFATLVIAFFNARYGARCLALERRTTAFFQLRCLPLVQGAGSDQVEIAKALATALGDAVTKLSVVLADLEGTAAELSTAASELGDSTLACTAETKRLLNAMQAAALSFVAEVKALNAQRGEIGDVVGAMQKTGGAIAQEARKTREAIENTESRQLVHLETQRQYQDQTLKSLRELLSRFDSILNDIAATAPESPIRLELLELRRGLTKQLTAVSQEMGSIRTDVTKQLRELGRGGARVPDPAARPLPPSVEPNDGNLKPQPRYGSEQRSNPAYDQKARPVIPRTEPRETEAPPAPVMQEKQHAAQPSTSAGAGPNVDSPDPRRQGGGLLSHWRDSIAGMFKGRGSKGR